MRYHRFAEHSIADGIEMSGVVCVSAHSNTQFGEIESYTVCMSRALKQWNILNYRKSAHNEERARNVFIVHTVHTGSNIGCSSIYSHDIRVPWTNTEEMHVYKSIDLCSRNDDEIHVLFYNFCAPQILMIFHMNRTNVSYTHICTHYIASPMILWCETIAHISSIAFVVFISFSIHMQNERWLRLWLFCSVHPHSMKSIVYLTFNI